MKVYYNQDKISRGFIKFFSNIFSLSKPIIKNLAFIIIGMISSESVVTSDFSRKLSDSFSLICLDSIERRFRRFFNSFSSFAYSSYESFIKFVISKYSIKHFDNRLFISFDHSFCRDKFTIILFSLRIGKQGIPLWFRCFKGNKDPEAFSLSLINQGISFCSDLFPSHYNLFFLADRWFSFRDIMQHIQSLNRFFCIRTKTNLSIHINNYPFSDMISNISDIEPLPSHSLYFDDVLITSFDFPSKLVVSKSYGHDDPFFILTNSSTKSALKFYGYRFGSIETIFKNQKSNGFRLESTNTQKIEHFISLFTVMCFAFVWLSIIGSDYVKNKHHYSLKIRDTKKHKNGSISRVFSLFNLGLTIFNLCYYSFVHFNLKFNFILYDL